MSDANESRRFDGVMPPEPMRTPLQKALQAADRGDSVCERFEEFVENFLRRSCAQKQFEETSGNCGEGCKTVNEPKIEPCLRLRWGDGPSDRLETEDTEILCITVCNPYSNVVLKNFTLHVIVTNLDGSPVPNQADGTPSVLIKPTFMICFDDIPACNPQQPQSSCVSREVVLINRGAKPGKYRVLVAYCYEACFHRFDVKPAFEIELVSS